MELEWYIHIPFHRFPLFTPATGQHFFVSSNYINSLFFSLNSHHSESFRLKWGPFLNSLFLCVLFSIAVLQNKSHFDKVENIVVKRWLFQTPWGRCLCFPLQLFPNPVNIIWNIVCQTTENSIESPEGYSGFFLMFFGLSVKHSGHKLCCVFPLVKYLKSTYTL